MRLSCHGRKLAGTYLQEYHKLESYKYTIVSNSRLPTIYHSQLYAMYQLTLIKLMIYWVQFHNDMGFMKSRKSTMNMEGVDMREESDIDMSHLVDRVERTFEEPSDIEVIRNILDRLTLSMTVDM